MVYRTHSPEQHEAQAEAEKREFLAVLHEAERRYRRAIWIVVGWAVATTFAVLLALIAHSRLPAHRSEALRHCHKVEIQWENAPALPPHVWTRCS